MPIPTYRIEPNLGSMFKNEPLPEDGTAHRISNVFISPEFHTRRLIERLISVCHGDFVWCRLRVRCETMDWEPTCAVIRCAALDLCRFSAKKPNLGISKGAHREFQPAVACTVLPLFHFRRPDTPIDFSPQSRLKRGPATRTPRLAAQDLKHTVQLGVQIIQVVQRHRL